MNQDDFPERAHGGTRVGRDVSAGSDFVGRDNFHISESGNNNPINVLREQINRFEGDYHIKMALLTRDVSEINTQLGQVILGLIVVGLVLGLIIIISVARRANGL